MRKTILLFFLIVCYNSIGQKDIRTTKSLNYKQKYESATFSVYSLIYQAIDPTFALRLAAKANELNSSSLNQKILKDIYNNNIGSFYTKQFDQSNVMSLQFLPGDSLFLAGGCSNKIYLWNIKSGKYDVIFHQDRKEILYEDERSTTYGSGGRVIYSLALHSSGNKFLAASDNEVVYWDILEKKPLQKFNFLYKHVEKIGFLNDSIFVCKVRSNDSISIQTFDVKKDLCLKIDYKKEKYFFDLVTLPNLQLYVTSSSDSLCEFWNFSEKTPLFSIKIPQPISKIAYNAASSLLALGGINGSIYLYDMNTKKIIRELQTPTGSITSISINSRKMVCVIDYTQLLSWDILSENSLQPLTTHKTKSNTIQVVEMSQFSDRFLSFSNIQGGSHSGLGYELNNFIRLWNINKTSMIKKESIVFNEKSTVALDFKRKIGVINTSKYSTYTNISISDLNTGVIIDSIIENSKILNLHISPNLKFIAYQLGNRKIKVYDVLKKTIVYEKQLTFFLKALAINDVKNQLLIINQSKYDDYQVWSMDSANLFGSVKHNEIARGASYSKNGKFLMVYGWHYVPSKNISVYSTDSYESLITYGESNKSTSYAIITNNGNYVVGLDKRNSLFNNFSNLDVTDVKSGAKIENSFIDIEDDSNFYSGENENEIYVVSPSKNLLYTWSLSPSLNEILNEGMICDYDSTYYQEETLLQECDF